MTHHPAHCRHARLLAIDMRSALIVYATTYGQTEKIAGYMAGRLRAQGCDAHALDAHATSQATTLDDYDAVLLGGSLYASHYQRRLTRFIEGHLDALNRHDNAAFFSVSASAARAEGLPAVEAIASTFLDDAGWHPRLQAHFAGAVKYPRYGFVVRRIMQRISRKAGGGTDARHEYEYTDWAAVDAWLEVVVSG